MREFVISKNDSGQRVDKFIAKACPELPHSLMYKSIRNKNIKLNRKRCEISTRLSEGDILQIYLPDDVFGKSGDDIFLSAPASLNIVYEDENILLADKKCGLVVHEDNSTTVDTLINRIKRYLYDKHEYDPKKEASFAPSLCNRLDRNTSGIVICAKNAESLRILNEKIKKREIHKNYLCAAVGTPPKQEDTITAYLEKNERTNKVVISDKKTENNKTIITKYKVLNSRNGLSLLDITLITGRTHQIRVHMAYIGCPVLGDGKYGDNRINKKYGVTVQALHSYKLTFDFTSEAGCLEYLNHREFLTKSPWFADKFFSDENESKK